MLACLLARLAVRKHRLEGMVAMEIDPAGNPAAAKEQEAAGSAGDDEFSDLTIVIVARLLRPRSDDL